GVDPRPQRAFDRDVVARLLGVAAHRLEAIAHRDRRFSRPYRLVDALLAVEMIVNERGADAHPLGDVLQGDAMIAVFGEQLLGRVEDALDRGFARAGLVLADDG